MAEDQRTTLFLIRQLLVLSLLVACARAAGDFKLPDYVTSHAPILRLHSDDPFRPSDLLTHVRHTIPVVDGKPIEDLPALDLDNLEILNKYGERVALNSKEDPLEYPDWYYGEAPDASGKIHNATPCVVVVVEKNERDIDAFYFYFYSWNEGPNITQVVKPLRWLIEDKVTKTGISFGEHVGDWEHNMIRFKDGKPDGIYYSQHLGGAAYQWDDPKVSKVDGRPVAYSATGSHAIYPEKGEQIHNVAVLDFCDDGPKWDPVQSAYFYHFDPATFTFTSLPAPGQSSEESTPANLTSFLYFTGIWGDDQYPDSDPRQATVRYFGLKRFLSGPTGPRWKHLDRRDLIPPGRHKPGVMENLAHLYLWLYPCCLRGWRVWVSFGVMVVIFSGVCIGIKVAISRYRGTVEYKKVQGNEIQLDDWRLEEEALLSSSDEEDDLRGRK